MNEGTDSYGIFGLELSRDLVSCCSNSLATIVSGVVVGFGFKWEFELLLRIRAGGVFVTENLIGDLVWNLKLRERSCRGFDIVAGYASWVLSRGQLIDHGCTWILGDWLSIWFQFDDEGVGKMRPTFDDEGKGE
ncbi:hypothetical protein Droror1_Dr00020386 [Drosera rotundifolia]